jgi:lipid A ethanolaminephosphotransferase
MQSIKNFFQNKEFSVNQVLVMLGLYYTFVLNYPFLSGFIKAIIALEHYNVLFLISVPFLLIALLILVFSLFSVRYLFKPAIILITIISAQVFYAGLSYGVVFDYGMIQNVFETNSAEALSYLNIVSILFFVVTGLLPAIILFKLKIAYKPFTKELLSRAKLIVITLLVLLTIAWAFYSSYAAVARNNSHLKRFIVPTQWVGSGYKYIRDHYFSTPREFVTLDPNPSLKATDNAKKKVVVWVVGETARAANFSYQGYSKPTNQYTQPYNVTYFKEVSSCGTATAVSVPCMFSNLTHDNFDRAEALSQQNILDIAKLAGADVLWLDNNSGCQDVCDRVPSIRIDTDPSNPLCDGKYCFDEVLLEPLQKKLASLSANTTFIVLHVIGSHGPTYYLRYPEKFKTFTPDCPKSDIQNCSLEQLVNTYDNTLAYTDFVLSKVMQTFTEHAELDANILYVSDHGESLGENGMYLHGFPYALAPSDQTHVPLWLWSNQSNDVVFSSCVQQKTTQSFKHDNIFHTMLGLLNVNTPLYETEQDILASCR